MQGPFASPGSAAHGSFSPRNVVQIPPAPGGSSLNKPRVKKRARKELPGLNIPFKWVTCFWREVKSRCEYVSLRCLLEVWKRFLWAEEFCCLRLGKKFGLEGKKLAHPSSFLHLLKLVLKYLFTWLSWTPCEQHRSSHRNSCLQSRAAGRLAWAAAGWEQRLRGCCAPPGCSSQLTLGARMLHDRLKSVSSQVIFTSVCLSRVWSSNRIKFSCFLDSTAHSECHQVCSDFILIKILWKTI